MPRLQRSQRQQKGRKSIQIVAEYELKNVSEELHKEQKDWVEEVRCSMRHWLR